VNPPVRISSFRLGKVGILNIFFLHSEPKAAAKDACDRHSIKMILESAQMLSTVLRQHGYEGDDIYGMTHVKHPSTIWASMNRDNFNWLLSHAFALCEEYQYRYGKVHKSKAILERCDDLCDFYIPKGLLTVPPKCMGDEFKVGGEDWESVVASYRKYYREGKTYMNRGNGPQWRKKPERCPSWFSSSA